MYSVFVAVTEQFKARPEQNVHDLAELSLTISVLDVDPLNILVETLQTLILDREWTSLAVENRSARPSLKNLNKLLEDVFEHPLLVLLEE